MYGDRCITGNLANVPSSTAPLTNPFVKDTNAFNGFNPMVPIWFKNPKTGTLDLVNTFPTASRDECIGFTANTVIEAAGTTAIPAGHTTATGATPDDCNIYIQNKNQLQLTLTLDTLAASVSTYRVSQHVWDRLNVIF